jgi:hypothetical protein
MTKYFIRSLQIPVAGKTAADARKENLVQEAKVRPVKNDTALTIENGKQDVIRVEQKGSKGNSQQ